MLYTIKGLKKEVRGVTIRVRVVSKDDIRSVHTKNGKKHRVVNFWVGDRTGSIILTLWDEQADLIEVNDVLDIQNGYVNRFRGRLQLNVGQYGHINKVQEPLFPLREELMERTQRLKRL